MWGSLIPASCPHRMWSTKDYRPPHHLALLFLLCFSSDGICPRIQSFGRAPTDSPCETHRSSLLRLTTMLRFSKPAVLTRRPLTTVPERNNSCCFQSQTLRPLTLSLAVVYLFRGGRSRPTHGPHLIGTIFHSCSSLLPLVFYLPGGMSASFCLFSFTSP